MADRRSTLGPAKSVGMARLAVLAYASASVPFLGALLPRGEQIVWPWLIAGAVLLVSVMVRAIVRLRRTMRGEGFGATSTQLLIENLVCLVGLASTSYGLSGAFGMYRLTLLGPVLLMAVIGSDRMLAVSWSVAVSLLVLITAGSLTDLTPLPAFTVVWGSGYLLLALFTRALSRRAERAMSETQLYTEITEVAASATHIYAALDDLMPVLQRYLDARRVVALRVRHRRVEDLAIAAWPINDSGVDGDARNDVRIAAVEGRTVERDQWICAPVGGTKGVELVLYVERNEQPVLRRLGTDDAAIERVTVQLGALLHRLDLIAELEGLTRTDSLTGLPNRRALAERLERELAVARRSEGGLSVAMIDLDHFKRYNDSFGHLAGDELLQHVAEMLTVRFRSTDFVARFGGEEFCAILPFTNATDAATVLKEVHRRGREIEAARPLTFSAGVAEWDGDESIEELMDRADRALYDAKAAGRARTRIAPLDTVRRDVAAATVPAAPPVPSAVPVDEVEATSPNGLTPSILENLRRPGSKTPSSSS